jgi:hypothetical protein
MVGAVLEGRVLGAQPESHEHPDFLPHPLLPPDLVRPARVLFVFSLQRQAGLCLCKCSVPLLGTLPCSSRLVFYPPEFCSPVTLSVKSCQASHPYSSRVVFASERPVYFLH